VFTFMKKLLSNLSVQAGLFSLVINVALFGIMALSFTSTAPTASNSALTPAFTSVPEHAPTVETPKPKYAEVIDVATSIASWNKEAWCRTHWDKGNKCWFKDRQKQYPTKALAIAKAFKAVWGNEPIEVQKLALALCLKETGCGFSEERNWKKSGRKITQTGERTYKTSKFMSSKEACGLTQVDTRDNIGKVKCAVLNASYQNAFKWQKIWLETYWNDGSEKRVKVSLYDLSWLNPVSRGGRLTYLPYRYNGGGAKAWAYGRKVMEIYKNHIVVQKVKIK
jgi:hypothetical protein